MTLEELAEIRARNDDDKAVQAAVVQPDGQIVRMAEAIDRLMAGVERLRQHILANHGCSGCVKVIGVDSAEYDRLHEIALDAEYGARPAE